jgi:hypothetical protein
LGRFRNDWEPLLWFQKPGGDIYFDKHAIASDAKSTYKSRSVRVREVDGSFYDRPMTGWAVDNGKMHRGTYWNYGLIGGGIATLPVLAAMGHPATFPYDFAIDVVRCFAPKHGLVVDPFLGSGTTAVAALDHGCDFIGGDLYGPSESEPWVRKVGIMLREKYDPGVLADFGGVSHPDIRVIDE